MTLAHYLFAAFVRPRLSGPLGALAIVGLVWWAVSASELVRRIDRHEPQQMSLADAVTASKDGEVYARLTSGSLDCSMSIGGRFDRTVALVDADGHVPAAARVRECPPAPGPLEGVFLDPPVGLYGEAIARGWDVPRGHLAFFDLDVGSSRAWTRIAVAAFAVPAVLACFVAGVLAERRRARRDVWRTRALGSGLMAGLAWLFYYAGDYVVLRVVPLSLLAATAFAVALAFAVFPTKPSVQRIAQRLLVP